jgi:hypothetical protein
LEQASTHGLTGCQNWLLRQTSQANGSNHDSEHQRLGMRRKLLAAQEIKNAAGSPLASCYPRRAHVFASLPETLGRMKLRSFPGAVKHVAKKLLTSSQFGGFRQQTPRFSTAEKLDLKGYSEDVVACTLLNSSGQIDS